MPFLQAGSIYRGLSAQHLALFRIFLLSFWLFEIGRSSLPCLSGLDPAWYVAHGPWLVVPRAIYPFFFDGPGLNWLKWTTFVSVFVVLVGVTTRTWSRVVMLLALLMFTSFLRGFGHPDHSHVQAYLVTLVLAFSPAWDRWSWSSKKSKHARNSAAISATRYSSPFLAMALVFSMPYFLTGVYRLAKEGIWIYLGPSMLHYLARDSLVLDDFDFGWGLWLSRQTALLPLLNISFLLVSLAELGAPWAPLKRSYCLAFLAIILPFHLLSPLLMHILFLPNIIVLVGLYLLPLLWQITRPIARQDQSSLHLHK